MTLPDDARAQLRTYFDALVPPRAVDDAVEDVAERFAHRTPEPPALFATAHTVLEEYGRVAFEVEVDVLVHDLGLHKRYAAIATGAAMAEVDAALETVAAAASELGLERDLPPDDDRDPVADRTSGTAGADTDEMAAEPVPEAPERDATARVATTDEAEAARAGEAEGRAGADFAAREPALVPPGERDEPSALVAERPVSPPSRRGPLLAIVAVFVGIALLVVVASAVA